MDVKAAYEIAKQGMEGRVLKQCLDVGDKWVFCFQVDSDDLPCPGDPLITIDKGTGAVDYPNLPDQKNFQLLEAGKTVPVRMVRGRNRIV